MAKCNVYTCKCNRKLSIKILAVTLLLCLQLLPQAARADTLLRLSTGDYEPFTGSQLPQGGPLTELVRRAFAEAGYVVEIDFLPWKRGYSGAMDGSYDATFPYGRNAERERDFLFSESFFTLDRRMYFRSGSAVNPADPSTFKGKTYCSPVGHTLYKEFTSLVEHKELNVQTAPNHASCAKMMAAARVDFFVTTADAGELAMAKAGLAEPLPYDPFGKSENHLLIAKTHPKARELMDAFNKGIAALKAKGDWARIISQHAL